MVDKEQGLTDPYMQVWEAFPEETFELDFKGGQEWPQVGGWKKEGLLSWWHGQNKEYLQKITINKVKQWLRKIIVNITSSMLEN